MRCVFVILNFALVWASCGVTVAVQGQVPYRNWPDSIFSAWELRELNERNPANYSGGPAIVSADELRHPVSNKARRALENAQRKGDSGDHSAAIEDLIKALIKYPTSAPYAYNLLGREYIECGDYVQAEESFEVATKLMPHQAAHHSNLGLSLAFLGQWDRAEQEVRKALQLDHANAKAKQILDAMRIWRSSRTVGAKSVSAK